MSSKELYGPMYIGDTYDKYKEEAGSYALPKGLYGRVLKRVFWLISRKVIVDRVEWEIPNKGGFYRVAKRKAQETSDKIKERYAKNGMIMTYPELTGGWYYHLYWDKKNKNCSMPVRDWWSFIPCEDQHNKRIGRRGLNKHVVDLALDPNKVNYHVVNKSRKKIRH